MLVKKQWVKVTVLGVFLAALLMGTFMIAPAAHAAGDDVRIRLRGSAQYPTAKGSAKYKDEGGEQEFEVELENAKALKGTTVRVFANGQQVGTMRVSRLGRASLNLNSDRGQAVPNIHAGSSVQIKTSSGVLIVSGSF